MFQLGASRPTWKLAGDYLFMQTSKQDFDISKPGELTSKLQIKTWFPPKSYPIMNPDTSGSITQCNIPTRSLTTGCRLALMWIVIMVSSKKCLASNHWSCCLDHLQESSPSLSIPKHLRTALFAPSHATRWQHFTVYSCFVARSSIVANTWSPRFINRQPKF